MSITWKELVEQGELMSDMELESEVFVLVQGELENPTILRADGLGSSDDLEEDLAMMLDYAPVILVDGDNCSP